MDIKYYKDKIETVKNEYRSKLYENVGKWGVQIHKQYCDGAIHRYPFKIDGVKMIDGEYNYVGIVQVPQRNIYFDPENVRIISVDEAKELFDKYHAEDIPSYNEDALKFGWALQEIEKFNPNI
jgi:hypothetical protein